MAVRRGDREGVGGRCEQRRALDLGLDVQRSQPLQRILHDGDATYLHMLWWTPGEHEVAFLLSGYQTSGPHSGLWGCWAGRVDVEDGSVDDIGFTPLHPGSWVRDVKISSDHEKAFFRVGASLYKVEPAGGSIVKLTDDVHYGNILSYSPSDRFVAYGVSWESPPHVLFYDLDTGVKNEILVDGIPEGQSAFLSGWSPQNLLCVSVAADDDVVHGENSSWPAAAMEVRLYDTEGELVRTLKSPTEDAADRIGSLNWSQDGETLAFMVGPVALTPSSGYFAELPMQDLRSAWTWEMISSGDIEKPEQLSVISGKVDEVKWVQGDTALEVWFVAPDIDDQATVQDGIILTLDGEMEQIHRDIPWRTIGWENEIGVIGEYRYFRANAGDVASLTRKGPDGKSELLLQGPYILESAGVKDGSFWCVVSSQGFPSRTRLLIYTPIE